MRIIVAILIKPKKQEQKQTQDTYLVSSLDHSLLALHLDVLLLLGVGQGEWHTEQESTGADNPEGLAAERKAGLGEVCDGRDGVGNSEAGGGGNDVFQSSDTLVERLGLELNILVVGDLGVYCSLMFMSDMSLDVYLRLMCSFLGFRGRVVGGGIEIESWDRRVFRQRGSSHRSDSPRK